MEEDQAVKHLEFIQAIIGRMANNSFLLKGWSVTLSSSLFALALNQSKPNLVILALFPALSFWGLDAFYLRHERLYRKLYEDLCRMPAESHKPIDRFSLSTERYKSCVHGWFRTLWTHSVIVLHGAVMLSLMGLILAFHFPSIRRFL